MDVDAVLAELLPKIPENIDKSIKTDWEKYIHTAGQVLFDIAGIGQSGLGKSKIAEIKGKARYRLCQTR